ncbi:MAG: hypothetical protein MUQ65_06690, partial [Armatimonadetes bacterium]|nr:hypothetical protein [Armatimonadota bacterium]
ETSRDGALITRRPRCGPTLGWLYDRKLEQELAWQTLSAGFVGTPPDNRALCVIVHRQLGTVCRTLGRLPEAEGHEAEARRSGD